MIAAARCCPAPRRTSTLPHEAGRVALSSLDNDGNAKFAQPLVRRTLPSPPRRRPVAAATAPSLAPPAAAAPSLAPPTAAAPSRQPPQLSWLGLAGGGMAGRAVRVGLAEARPDR